MRREKGERELGEEARVTSNRERERAQERETETGGETGEGAETSPLRGLCMCKGAARERERSTPRVLVLSSAVAAAAICRDRGQRVRAGDGTREEKEAGGGGVGERTGIDRGEARGPKERTSNSGRIPKGKERPERGTSCFEEEDEDREIEREGRGKSEEKGKKEKYLSRRWKETLRRSQRRKREKSEPNPPDGAVQIGAGGVTGRRRWSSGRSDTSLSPGRVDRRSLGLSLGDPRPRAIRQLASECASDARKARHGASSILTARRRDTGVAASSYRRSKGIPRISIRNREGVEESREARLPP